MSVDGFILHLQQGHGLFANLNMQEVREYWGNTRAGYSNEQEKVGYTLWFYHHALAHEGKNAWGTPNHSHNGLQ